MLLLFPNKIIGTFKFGSIIKYIPYPVTVGFTSGIAVTIFSGQLKNFFGLDFAGFCRPGVGVVMAALLFIKRVSDIRMVSSLEDNIKIGSEGSKRLHASIVEYPQISLYEINGPMFFGAASVMQEHMGYSQDGVLIIRMKHVGAIDATATHALELLIEEVHAAGGKVILATVQKYVLLNLNKTGIINLLGGEKYLAKSSTEAIAMAKEMLQNK